MPRPSLPSQSSPSPLEIPERRPSTRCERHRLRREAGRWTALVGSLASILVLAACEPAAKGPTLEPSRGVILISIDTLRADFLGAYGEEADTSPFLDSLAARGALFERAYAHLPGTLPSHMSIFTGLYPGEHGVYPPEGVLSPELPSLPVIFSDAGYRTAGFTEGGYVSGSYGFERGFDEWNDQHKGGESDIERTMAKGLDFLKSLGAEDTFFLFLHSYSVHDPYTPPESYLERFWEGERPADFFVPSGPNLVQVNKGKRTLSPELLAYFRACYQASIAYMDDVLKGFFTELEILGLADQITVVLTSDHGESFLEHGTVVHSSVYPEDLHVPLLVLHPGLESGVRIPDVVESVDIPATLYDLAGLGAEGLSGRSLRPLMEQHPVDEGRKPGAAEEQEIDGAYGEAFISADETLVARLDGRLLQLVLARAKIPPKAHYFWVQQALTFDQAPGTLKLNLRGYHVDRTVTIEIDGEPYRTVELGADAPQEVAIEIPDDRPWGRVRISGETCDIPAEVSESKDERCLTFGLFQPPRSLVRFELYDLDVDPSAQNDLSRQESSLLRRLVAHLQRIEHQARAEGQNRPLDPELEERLRSLGYLQ